MGLDRGLDHSWRDYSLNPLNGAKTTNFGGEIQCRFSLTFPSYLEHTHKQTCINTKSNVRSVFSNLWPWLRAAVGKPLSPEDAVGCQLWFIFLWHSIQSLTAKSHWLLPCCKYPEGSRLPAQKSTHQQDAIKLYFYTFIQVITHKLP